MAKQQSQGVAETMPSPHMLCLWDYFPKLEKKNQVKGKPYLCGQQNVFEDVNVTFACESLWTHVNQLAYATRGHPPKQTSCESNAPCAFHKSVICGV